MSHSSLMGSDLLRQLVSLGGKKPQYRRGDNVLLLSALWQEWAPLWPVLIVEEAQDLNPAALEELRLLTCARADTQTPFSSSSSATRNCFPVWISESTAPSSPASASVCAWIPGPRSPSRPTSRRVLPRSASTPPPSKLPPRNSSCKARRVPRVCSTACSNVPSNSLPQPSVVRSSAPTSRVPSTHCRGSPDPGIEVTRESIPSSLGLGRHRASPRALLRTHRPKTPAAPRTPASVGPDPRPGLRIG